MAINEKVLSWNGYDVVTSLSFWAGVEEDLNGIWIGATGGECARFHIDPPSPTATVDDIINDINHHREDIAEWIEDHGGPEQGSPAGAVLATLALIIIGLIIAENVVFG